MRGPVRRLAVAVRRARARRHAEAPARRNRSRGDRCYFCDTPFTDDGHGDASRTVDHRRARSRGGSDSLANLVFACRGCNERKADRTEAEFLASGWLAARRAERGGDAAPPRPC